MKLSLLILLFTFISCESDYKEATINDKVSSVKNNADYLSAKYGCLRLQEKYECTPLGSIMLINPRYAEVELESNPYLLPYLEKFYVDILKSHSLEQPHSS